MTTIFVNGSFYKEDEAKISVRDRGFRFGDGIFETLSFYNGKIYQWPLHYKRLLGGLEATKINFDTSTLHDDIINTIRKNNITSGLGRITITRGIGSQGYMPTPDIKSNIAIEVMEMPSVYWGSGKLCVSSYRKIPAKCMPINFKLAQGMNSTLARIEAMEKGYLGALMMNIKGEIAECESGNIFWVKNKTIYTPRFDCDILEGIIRHLVIEKSPYRIIQGKFALRAIKSADEVFMTSTRWKVLPITEIEGLWKMRKDNPISKHIKSIIEDDIKTNCA